MSIRKSASYKEKTLDGVSISSELEPKARVTVFRAALGYLHLVQQGTNVDVTRPRTRFHLDYKDSRTSLAARIAYQSGDFNAWYEACCLHLESVRFIVSYRETESGVILYYYSSISDNQDGCRIVDLPKDLMFRAFTDIRYPLPPRPLKITELLNSLSEMERLTRMRFDHHSTWLLGLINHRWHPSIASEIGECVKELIKSGLIDLTDQTIPNRGPGSHGTYLESAIVNYNHNAIKLLIQMGAKLEMVPAKGWTIPTSGVKVQQGDIDTLLDWPIYMLPSRREGPIWDAINSGVRLHTAEVMHQIIADSQATMARDHTARNRASRSL